MVGERHAARIIHRDKRSSRECGALYLKTAYKHTTGRDYSIVSVLAVEITCEALPRATNDKSIKLAVFDLGVRFGHPLP